ncbi:hypothetical protein GLOTRDRAFT_17874, partial [Gloeophyllum trabeum ATCC 11539]
VRIAEKPRQIHHCAISHNPLRDRHVTLRNGDFRILDFRRSSRHKCPCDSVITSGHQLPDVSTFGCWNLWAVC